MSSTTVQQPVRSIVRDRSYISSWLPWGIRRDRGGRRVGVVALRLLELRATTGAVSKHTADLALALVTTTGSIVLRTRSKLLLLPRLSVARVAVVVVAAIAVGAVVVAVVNSICSDRCGSDKTARGLNRCLTVT